MNFDDCQRQWPGKAGKNVMKMGPADFRLRSLGRGKGMLLDGGDIRYVGKLVWSLLLSSRNGKS